MLQTFVCCREPTPHPPYVQYQKCCMCGISVRAKQKHRRRIGCFTYASTNAQPLSPPTPSENQQSPSPKMLVTIHSLLGSHYSSPSPAPPTVSFIESFRGLDSSSHLPISSPPICGKMLMFTLFRCINRPVFVSFEALES